MPRQAYVRGILKTAAARDALLFVVCAGNELCNMLRCKVIHGLGRRTTSSWCTSGCIDVPYDASDRVSNNILIPAIDS